MHDSKFDEIIFSLGDVDRVETLENHVLGIVVQTFDADQDNPEERKIQ